MTIVHSHCLYVFMSLRNNVLLNSFLNYHVVWGVCLLVSAAKQQYQKDVRPQSAKNPMKRVKSNKIQQQYFFCDNKVIGMSF